MMIAFVMNMIMMTMNTRDDIEEGKKEGETGVNIVITRIAAQPGSLSGSLLPNIKLVMYDKPHSNISIETNNNLPCH